MNEQLNGRSKEKKRANGKQTKEQINELIN